MESRVKLTDDAWVYGSYPRITYKKDTIYTFYLYRDVQAVYNMGRFHICDGLMERLFQEGLISDGEKAEFDRKIYRFIAQVERYDDWPIEKIYGEIQRIRKSCVAEALLEQDQERRIRQGCDFILQGGIDQNRKKEELIEKKKLLFLLSANRSCSFG